MKTHALNNRIKEYHKAKYEYYDLGKDAFAYDTGKGSTILKLLNSDLMIIVDYNLNTIFIYDNETNNNISRVRNRFFKEVNGFEEIADTRSLDKAIDNGYFETEYGEYWEVELG